MKLTKAQIESTRDELCRRLIEAARLRAKCDVLKKDLEEDFVKNEKQYRDGIRTPSGIIYRKPRFELTAKEPVEA